MNEIQIEKFDRGGLESSGADSWPIWEKGVSCFDWSYDVREICYILEGKATVKTDSGDVVTFGSGDKVTFPKGLNCTWDITEPIKKHYSFK